MSRCHGWLRATLLQGRNDVAVSWMAKSGLYMDIKGVVDSWTNKKNITKQQI